MAALIAGPLAAEELRVAFFNAELKRKGPGLLLRDIARGEDAQVAAVQSIIKLHAPDILLISGFDYDGELRALNAFNQGLGEARYLHLFARRPNTGMATGLDMNGDGALGTPKDAQGFGYFSGQDGLALLSRHPIKAGGVQDHSNMLWKDTYNAHLPSYPEGRPFPSREAQAVQRLATVAHWVVPIALPSGKTLTLLAYQASPPVFDGAEDQNGKRNLDENLFWQHLLDGRFGPPPAPPLVLLAGANLDPADGEGRHEGIQALLTHPALRDPRPKSAGAKQAANANHIGDPALDTADWRDPKPGNMRVDYVLPSRDITVRDAGVFWPGIGASSQALAERASRHRLVWVDIQLP